MQVHRTSLDGVLIIDPDVFADERGFFLESWTKARFAEHGLGVDFVQDNHSRSHERVLRGMHYQVGAPQGKLVRVTAGEVFDVAVDVRRASPTFGRWTSALLSADNRRLFWIPDGFAHGFFVVRGPADVLYKATAPYRPELERTIRWNDPAIGITWPELGGAAPILSPRDADAPLLAHAETLA